MSKPRYLYEIAKDVYADWKNVHYTARPYLAAMTRMSSVTEMYVHDSGRDVVLRFLSNASTWRGEVARRVKSELKELLK